MKLPSPTRLLPSWQNAALAVLSAVLLILAFPDFEFSFLAWFALVPLLWAVEREKGSLAKSFFTGWLFGVVFFFGTCWWLTFAPITYAGFPWWLAYFLLLVVTAIVGIFPGIFAGLMSAFLERFGNITILAAPFVWVFTEFLRYWLTGNNWNALGYAAAFDSGSGLKLAASGGVYLTGFLYAAVNAFFVWLFISRESRSSVRRYLINGLAILGALVFLLRFISSVGMAPDNPGLPDASASNAATIVAIQPNVPMSGLTYEKWQLLRHRHVELAESALRQLPAGNPHPVTVIFPESPMNFMYDEDPEFQAFISGFAAKHNVNVLFNSAEPDPKNKKYFNSAVLVDSQGKEVAQYDKIYLVPFGESVPAPLQSIVPAFVGSFSYGDEYDLLPLGDAKAGVMICFESHFGQLARQYVQNGADVLIEMTNDGYLGPTPVLRQHLANAVFRAVETNRPVLRVTNVGVTAYITETGDVIDPAEPYQEDTRIWSVVSKSNSSQTFYVKHGDWFAWLCSIVTMFLLALSILPRVGEKNPE